MTTLDEFKQDSDWRQAFSEAVNGGYMGWYGDDAGPIQNVTKVHYAAEGENDGDQWLAIVDWGNASVAVMEAGCDYTGWD